MLFVVGLICIILIVVSILKKNETYFVLSLVIALFAGITSKEVPCETHRTPVVIEGEYRCINGVAYQKVDGWVKRDDWWVICNGGNK